MPKLNCLDLLGKAPAIIKGFMGKILDQEIPKGISLPNPFIVSRTYRTPETGPVIAVNPFGETPPISRSASSSSKTYANRRFSPKRAPEDV